MGSGAGCRRWMQEEDAPGGCRGMQEVDAGGGCRGWMQGVDAGGVQVDPPGWLRAPYSPGPNSQANDFITKRVEKLKLFAGDRASEAPAAGVWDPRWRGAPKRISRVRNVLGRRLGPQVAVSGGEAGDGGRVGEAGVEAGDGGRRKEEEEKAQ